MTGSRYSGILADLDGTMFRGNQLISSADKVYEHLNGEGIRWVFLSNNATRMAHHMVDKITRVGIPVSEDQVLNSASALVRALLMEPRGTRVAVVGEDRLVQGLREAGIHIVDGNGDADILVTAMDRQFTYAKLARAQNLLHKGARFWATNLDAGLPVEDGLRPGAGSLVAAIACAASKQPERIMGKPSPDLAALALEILNLTPSECLVVGDRMETDILFARNAGIDSALVLTGATTRDDISRFDYQPDYVLDSIAQIGSVIR